MRPEALRGLRTLVVALAAVGCGSSGGGGPKDAGGGDGATDSGTPMSCVAINAADKEPYQPNTIPSYTCNASASTMHADGPSACRNEGDCGFIATGRVREIVRTCGLSCRSYEPDCAMMAACNTECVRTATATMIMPPGLSDACGGCYTNVALCSLAYCLSECAANADAIECVKCQFMAGCRVAFERCSGLDRQ